MDTTTNNIMTNLTTKLAFNMKLHIETFDPMIYPIWLIIVAMLTLLYFGNSSVLVAFVGIA